MIPDLYRQWIGGGGHDLDLQEHDFSAGGRTRLRGHAVYPSVEARDGMVASGVQAGMDSGYASLDALLAGE